jgi:hypothetical protein
MVQVIWRAVRVALAVSGGAFLSSLANNEALIFVAPLISAVFKSIREKFPKLWWIPL